MSDEEIRLIYPVNFASAEITYIGTSRETVTHPNDIYARIIGEADFIHVTEACANAPRVLEALARYCEETSEDTSHEKYLVLDRVFWSWYSEQPAPKLPKKTRKTLTKGDYGKSPSEIIDRATKRAIWAKKSGLPVNKNGVPFYRLAEREHRAMVTLVPPTGKEVEDMAEYAANVFNTLDDLTNDVFQICALYWRECRDKKDFVEVWAKDILNERGLKQKTHKETGKPYKVGHRPEDIADVARCIEQLRNFKFTIGTIYWNGRKLKTPIVRKGYLLVVSEEITQHGKPIGWKFKFYDGLEELVRHDRFQNTYRKAFAYNTLKQSPEKRLSAFIDEGFRLSGNRPFKRSMSNPTPSPPKKPPGILETLNLPFDIKEPKRSISRILAALKKLKDDGGLGGCGVSLGKEVISNDIEDIESLQLPARRLEKAFKALDFWFFPPKSLPEIDRPRKALKKGK
jgi:hypothetical protein